MPTKYTYINNYAYRRYFGEIQRDDDGTTLELDPGEEVTFRQPIDHPNLTLVTDSPAETDKASARKTPPPITTPVVAPKE